MRVSLSLKIGWSLWVAVWAPVYWQQYGLQNLLYFCDLGNILIAIGLWLESPLIFSWQAAGLLVFQILYTVDLTGALISGRHFIGGSEFMFDAGIPQWIRLLSLFHVVTPPLLLWFVRRMGYDRRGWRYATRTAWILLPICYWWRPEFDVNWARGPFGHEQQLLPGPVYLVAYLIVVPLAVYWPTDLFLRWWGQRQPER